MATVRCACIDIGSNTTRLLVADVRGDTLVPVCEGRVFTRLGAALGPDGRLEPAALDRLVAVLGAMRDEARGAGAQALRAVATAAIRRAADPPAILAALRTRTGVVVELLPGEEEARLAFAGATRTLESAHGRTIAVVDVGGGSTEIAVGTVADGVTAAWSLPVGSGLLASGCAHDPPDAADRERMRAHALRAFAGADLPAADVALAVGGSALSLPVLAGPQLDCAALERALGHLVSAPAAEVARRHGLAPERTHLLPAGILVLDAAVRSLGRPLRIGRGGLREGVVHELAAR